MTITNNHVGIAPVEEVW